MLFDSERTENGALILRSAVECYSIQDGVIAVTHLAVETVEVSVNDDTTVYSVAAKHLALSPTCVGRCAASSFRSVRFRAQISNTSPSPAYGKTAR